MTDKTVVVPVEPTEDMVDAALRFHPDFPRCAMHVAIEDAIAAAPTPLTGQGEGQVFPARYFASGPPGDAWFDDFNLACSMVNAFDIDDDWTITDTLASKTEV